MAVKPRNDGEWTEARYWSQIRSHLRKAFQYWKPIQRCKMNARRPNQSANKRMKWEYQCAHCTKWFADKNVQVDHVIPAGSLKCLADIAGFVERLSAESEDAYQLLCKPCHNIKTQEERKK